MEQARLAGGGAARSRVPPQFQEDGTAHAEFDMFPIPPQPVKATARS